ncbi:hypothetical protein [Moraxella bovis]|uniref:Uncharacterized protein n=1 Tax=Moraxella bovis TaxID=476 RepID=A0ABY6M5X4_MORBO|nr:hypothetical protein [Moraxella bovis]UZA02957.1 hypothetical protein LP092_13630 [Moraxella bovis]UZA54050.1 hypothetical protein LP111_12845 [Moraxella bovis]UZA57344.1 hypothetical protein LP127_01330 [Moraxella bovis]
MIEKQIWISFELDDLDFNDICDWIESRANDSQLENLRELLETTSIPKDIKELARVLLYRGEQDFLTQFKEYINQHTELYISHETYYPTRLSRHDDYS